jgi:hypothetical protein
MMEWIIVAYCVVGINIEVMYTGDTYAICICRATKR